MEIHPFAAGHSTAYLVVQDGRAMLVDAAMPEIAPRVLATLADLGATLNLIVLTHYHYDHTGAADALREATGARVAIHRKDADALRAGQKLNVTPTRLMARILAVSVDRHAGAPVSPDLEFGDEEDLEQYGGIGHSFWTPGHTAGSQSVVLPDGTVLVGDAMSEGFPPLHRAEGPLFIEDAEAGRASIVAIADAATREVRVAHFGRLDDRSLRVLADRYRTGAR